MKELLSLCGYEDKEIKKEMPRIGKAFGRLKISLSDVERAKRRLKKHFEVDLLGFRKLLNVYIKELVNLMLVEEEKGKRIYNTMPSLSSAIGSAAALADESVYAGFPSIILLMTYHAIFEKMAPVWEASEKEILTAEEAHCGCNMCKSGGHILGLFPKPDLQLAWGIFCDEAAKVDEYLEVGYDVPLVTVNRIRDENGDETIPDRSILYVADELRKMVGRVSAVIGRRVKDEMLWQSLLESRKYMQATEQILQLLATADPVPLSVTTMWYVFIMYACNPSRENVEVLQDAIDTLLREVTGRAERGEGYYDKGAPRISMFLPSFIDPTIGTLIKDVGLAVPIVELNWYPGGALAPELGETLQPDPYTILAMGMLNVPQIGPFKQRLSAFNAAIKTYNIDGVLGLFPFSCRPIAADSLILKDAIRKESDIPVLILEGDVYDDRRYPMEVLRTRIESFSEICKMYTMTKRKNAA
jgi:hypothetical protein